ncbi:MAG: sialate O-acetylesterase [Monoglobaceae bacterium]
MKNGAVLQRDENNLCKITVNAEFNGKPNASLGYFEKIDENIWEFKGVFVGGPYNISISDDDSSTTFNDIYVGDVWLLAGQSNMEGAGYPTYEDRIYSLNPNSNIRALYMEEEWKPAKPIMSNLSKSTDEVHQQAHNNWINSIEQRKITVRDIPPYEMQRRIGPGLWFAEEMYKLTGGIPQGLVLSAVGGAPIDMWLPDSKNGNYFDAASRRIYQSGNNIKGIFWAQGEGNSNWEIYPEQIETMRKSFCEQLGIEQIPFVQMQSFRCTIDMSNDSQNSWSKFREMQRKMQYIMPLTETIATNDLDLCDCIHLSSDSQKRCGIRAANAMYYLISGEGYPQPAVESIELEKAMFTPDSGTTVKIKYKNLCGDLKSVGVPFGFVFRISGSSENPTIQNMAGIKIRKNVVQISIEKNIEEVKEYEIFYGFGQSFYCNITDGADRAIPAMGPIRIKDYM